MIVFWRQISSLPLVAPPPPKKTVNCTQRYDFEEDEGGVGFFLFCFECVFVF